MTAPEHHHAPIAVVGVTGYTGFELAKLLLRHPAAGTPIFFLRDAKAGTPQLRCLTQLFPELRGWGQATVRALSVDAVAASGARIVFLSTPHEASLELAPALHAAGLRVIDLSGAFRFADGATFTEWYGLPAPPQPLLDGAVYGLPELYADKIPGAQIVANPGCYPTSVILALRPLAEAGWLARGRGVVCDCKSGTSGAGKEPKRETHFVEVNENFRAYGLFTHRHTPEVLEHTGLDARDVIFSTHLLPVERGILSTISLWLDAPRRGEEIEALYRKFYAGRPLVRIWPAQSGQREGPAQSGNGSVHLPSLRHVTGTNFCDIGFALDAGGERLIVVSCLDNLGKGAAGQAVQNFNLLRGLPEETGLI